MAKKLWQPGQSGNPNGRPKQENSMAGALRKVLEEVGEDGVKTNKELLARRFVQIGLTATEVPAIVAIKSIYDRIDGRPRETIDHTVTERRPVIFDSAWQEVQDAQGEDGQEALDED